MVLLLLILALRRAILGRVSETDLGQNLATAFMKKLRHVILWI